MTECHHRNLIYSHSEIDDSHETKFFECDECGYLYFEMYSINLCSACGSIDTALYNLTDTHREYYCFNCEHTWINSEVMR
jgi:hypothetical protein